MAHDDGESRVISRAILLILSLIFTSAATIVFVLLSPTLSLYFTKSTSSAWVFAVPEDLAILRHDCRDIPRSRSRDEEVCISCEGF